MSDDLHELEIPQRRIEELTELLRVLGYEAIPRARLEALEAAAAILETEHDFDDSEADTCPLCRAIAALRAAGIQERK